jgi:hypothetical protein
MHLAALLFIGFLLWAGLPVAGIDAADESPRPPPDGRALRGWVAEMKQSPKGPFQSIRWFCSDGSVLPPRAYACAEHGGGIQHGQWTPRVARMREGGYHIANVLAGLEAEDFVGPEADVDTLKQILLERFLIGADDGWIFRGARSYRGALQAEDEEAGARRMVLAMLGDPDWLSAPRYRLLRESVRLLPLQANQVSASSVRHRALVIAEKDPRFAPLRSKIHNVPDSGDAERVRQHARAQRTAGSVAELADEYQKLAAEIDALYAEREASATLHKLADRSREPSLARLLRAEAALVEAVSLPVQRLRVASHLMERIRRQASIAAAKESPAVSLGLLQASLALEREVFTSGNAVLQQLPEATRRERLAWLGDAAASLYGAGLIGGRQLSSVRKALRRIDDVEPVSVDEYRAQLRYLARVPEWSGRWLAFDFSETVDRFKAIETLAHLYPQDRMRGSPLLFYGAVVDSLGKDANRLGGIEHELFGERVGAGLRALNPGLARGVLQAPADVREEDRLESDGVYLLPETTSDLPRVGGILTRGEGSSLSHVQLLARNLGIPNVVVAEELLPKVRAKVGTRVVLAVSPNGVVQIAEDGSRWERVFGEKARSDVVIRPDLEKLDLEVVDLIPLSRLRATDSGRISGPKGANLGELKHAFGDTVPNGFVIPFGVFRRLIDQPIESGGPSVFEWMKESYATIDELKDRPEEQHRVASEFLARLRHWIESCDPGPDFHARLRRSLEQSFGEDGSYGVFVRSDTNVEDLPGFTGAGLNLTVPNVVGSADILLAIRRVWASPFTERAYGWRQRHMEKPEYVFPAVVVQFSFPAEKSGVMVTSDVDTGRSDWLTVAVSEGVGGAVEGQAAESLRIDRRTGEVLLLAQATAPRRAVLSLRGGIDRVPASGGEAVLEKHEITQLVRLANQVPERFPSLRTENGAAVPADIEFAFRDGRLALLQMRPFVENRSAQRNLYLASLDAGFGARGSEPVNLDTVPENPR